MVADAQRSRAPIQRLSDVVSAYFVLAVVLAAAGTLVGWGLFGPEPRWTYGIVNAVAVLISGASPAAAQPRHHAEHPAEPLLRLRLQLQRAGRPSPRRNLLSS